MDMSLLSRGGGRRNLAWVTCWLFRNFSIFGCGCLIEAAGLLIVTRSLREPRLRHLEDVFTGGDYRTGVELSALFMLRWTRTSGGG